MKWTALLSALAHRVRSTIVGAPNHTRAGWLAGWLMSHETNAPATGCEYCDSLSPVARVTKHSSPVKSGRRARSSFVPHPANRTEQRLRAAEPNRIEPSRVESSRNRTRGARAPHLSDALRARHRVSRVRAPCHTIPHRAPNSSFFSDLLSGASGFWHSPRAPCRTLDSREDRRSRPNSLSARNDNAIRCVVAFELVEGISEKCSRRSAWWK